MSPACPTETFNNSLNARLAQSVERETLNLKVAGSTPASGSIPDALHPEAIAAFDFFFDADGTLWRRS